MAKTKEQKQLMVEKLASKIKQAKAVVFANFQGLKVKESDELRSSCKDQGISYTITKKTLLKKALQEAGFDLETKSFPGGVSVVTGENDEVLPAQIVAKFTKGHEIVKIFGGMLEGKFIDSTMVNNLSSLPSKQQLLGQLVGTLNAPVSGFANVLAGNLRNLVGVMNAIKDKKA